MEYKVNLVLKNKQGFFNIKVNTDTKEQALTRVSKMIAAVATDNKGTGFMYAQKVNVGEYTVQDTEPAMVNVKEIAYIKMG